MILRTKLSGAVVGLRVYTNSKRDEVIRYRLTENEREESLCSRVFRSISRALSSVSFKVSLNAAIEALRFSSLTLTDTGANRVCCKEESSKKKKYLAPPP